MEFQDGMAYDIQTPIGTLTIVCDARAAIPLRIYGPDGMQVDPIELARFESDGMFGGYLAYDLRKFNQRSIRRRRRRKGDSR